MVKKKKEHQPNSNRWWNSDTGMRTASCVIALLSSKVAHFILIAALWDYFDAREDPALVLWGTWLKLSVLTRPSAWEQKRIGCFRFLFNWAPLPKKIKCKWSIHKCLIGKMLGIPWDEKGCVNISYYHWLSEQMEKNIWETDDEKECILLCSWLMFPWLWCFAHLQHSHTKASSLSD